MGNNEIYNKKIMTFSVDTTRVAQKSKGDILLEILEHPPILMRTHREDLITFNGDKEEPRLKWREDILAIMDETQLRTLLTFIENQNGNRTRKY